MSDKSKEIVMRVTEQNESAAPETATLGGSELSVGLEGWTWIYHRRKWHYYRNYKALCGRSLLLRHPNEGYQSGNDGSKDNCAACKRKRFAETSNAALEGRARQ